MLAETSQTRDEAVHYWKTCRLSMNQRILLGSASQLASTPHIPESLAPARCYGIDVRDQSQFATITDKVYIEIIQI
jgi:hypothetical protein